MCVGNGPCHHSPCRYAYAGWPAPYTKDGLLEVWATCPPTMHHHRLPMRGTRDGERHPHSAKPRHQACWSSPLHAIARCNTAWIDIGSCRQLQSFCRPSTASLLGQRYKKVHLMRTVTSLAYSHLTSCLRDAMIRHP